MIIILSKIIAMEIAILYLLTTDLKFLISEKTSIGLHQTEKNTRQIYDTIAQKIFCIIKLWHIKGSCL